MALLTCNQSESRGELQDDFVPLCRYKKRWLCRFDNPNNHSIIEFVLLPVGEKTKLSVNISNFPTEVIFKHLNFYWTTTIHRLKDLAEQAHRS